VHFLELELAVKRAQKGNQEAFIFLIHQFEENLYRVAHAILKNEHDCADAIQEMILKAYQSIHTLKNPKFIKTWLVRILINQCNQLLKKKKKVVSFSELQEVASNIPDFERVELEEALSSLDPDLRLVVTLYYLEDIPLKEIAQLLEIPQGTIKSRLHRARNTLAKWLNTSKGGVVQL
jgi:RNA polymerase sigma-70 factor (ECF subfamily)